MTNDEALESLRTEARTLGPGPQGDRARALLEVLDSAETRLAAIMAEEGYTACSGCDSASGIDELHDCREGLRGQLATERAGHEKTRVNLMNAEGLYRGAVLVFDALARDDRMLLATVNEDYQQSVDAVVVIRIERDDAITARNREMLARQEAEELYASALDWRERAEAFSDEQSAKLKAAEEALADAHDVIKASKRSMEAAEETARDDRAYLLNLAQDLQAERERRQAAEGRAERLQKSLAVERRAWSATAGALGIYPDMDPDVEGKALVAKYMAVEERAERLAAECVRLHGVEHYAWHILDDSEDLGGTTVVRSDDAHRLGELLPESHPRAYSDQDDEAGTVLADVRAKALKTPRALMRKMDVGSMSAQRFIQEMRRVLNDKDGGS